MSVYVYVCCHSQDLRQIIKSSETLQALVNDILFISKMQTAGFELDMRRFDVCELVEDVTHVLSLRCGARVECSSNLSVPEFTYEVSYFIPLINENHRSIWLCLPHSI